MLLLGVRFIVVDSILVAVGGVRLHALRDDDDGDADGGDDASESTCQG